MSRYFRDSLNEQVKDLEKNMRVLRLNFRL